jgi:hypothetical protein
MSDDYLPVKRNDYRVRFCKEEVLYNIDAQPSLKAGRERFVKRWAGEPDGQASHETVNLMKKNDCRIK